jgi:phosphohistidine phosphatase
MVVDAGKGTRVDPGQFDCSPKVGIMVVSACGVIMMKLYLVQHAEAKSKQEDPDRPLSEKGRADISKVAAYVAEQTSPQVAHIIHSGKSRAQQTAEVVAKAIPPSDGVSISAKLAPLTEPSIWTERLAATDTDTILVGHLPHLSNLAALLLCQDEDNKVVSFQMGGVVCLGRDEEGNWSLQWMVTPAIVA